MNEVEKITEELIKERDKINNKLINYRSSAFRRFPLLFVLLSSFGLVATFYGFEKVIDKIDFFSDNPAAILITGILILILTGSLFKKLN